MKTLILGATGATGKLLAEQMLNAGKEVKLIVRSIDRLPENIRNHKLAEIIEADILDIDIKKMSGLLLDCDSAGICLGHNLTLKGIYGKPHKLVRDAVRLVCFAAIKKNAGKKFRLVLMNTTGNRNRDLKEKRTIGERLVISLLRLLLPPQPDNEKAAEHLRVEIGSNHPQIEWVAVRPDGLIDDNEVSAYKVFESPQCSPIFNAGKTSRINVAHFMSQLILDDKLMENWKGQMPVVYNDR